MIGKLQGVVEETAADGSCILNVNGVGYEVFVPYRNLLQLSTPPQETTLHIHTHVREDTFTLYGFENLEDRAAFRALIGISGIGPKLALTILNELTASELAIAVAREDKSRFKGISGIGKRTAERLVLDLRDKLPRATTSLPRNKEVTKPLSPGKTSTEDTVVSTLVQMGFSRGEAERALANVFEPDVATSTEELLRKALVSLA